MNQYERPATSALRAQAATGLDRHLPRPCHDRAAPTPSSPPADHEGPRAVARSLDQAREEERLRLRRELHDSLGPHLAAVHLRLNAAQACGLSSSAASEHLRVAVEALGEALTEVRRITAATAPATLLRRGLLEATRDLAHRLSTEKVQVEVVSPDQPLPALTATVAAAAYRITAEALTNAVRHSAARRVQVHISLCYPTLTIRVTDDGTGLSARAVDGLGLASVAERAAETGGSATLDTGPHGTVVRVALPVTAAQRLS